MQCDNCGYIFFQPAKKCTCCGAPYAPAQSAFDVGQEHLFTIFEMAAGEGGIQGMAEAGSGVADDYNFTDDFDTGETEYGVDENVLDLSDAEAEGFGVDDSSTPVSVDDFEFDTSGMMDDAPATENAASENFDLNISDDLADTEVSATETKVEAADDALDIDFGDGFDEEEVEGLGFGLDESPTADEAPEAAEDEISLDIDALDMDAAPEAAEDEISLDIDAAPEAEISLEPELELTDDEEPSLELSEEPELELSEDEEPVFELPEDPSMELSEEPELDATTVDTFEEESSFDISDEPELMDTFGEESTDVEDEAGLEFDLDGVDLDEPEEVAFEVPEAETATEEEPSMDFDGLELEMESPDEPEDEELKP